MARNRPHEWTAINGRNRPRQISSYDTTPERLNVSVEQAAIIPDVADTENH